MKTKDFDQNEHYHLAILNYSPGENCLERKITLVTFKSVAHCESLAKKRHLFFFRPLSDSFSSVAQQLWQQTMQSESTLSDGVRLVDVLKTIK